MSSAWSVTGGEDAPSHRQQPCNPLLTEEVLSLVFSYLDCSKDLESSSNVCTLWRSLSPPHILRTRPPIIISGSMEDEVCLEYMEQINRNPSLMAAKFVFRDADLNSSSVQNFLAVNGASIKQLELTYTEDEWEGIVSEDMGRRDALIAASESRISITKALLHDLLINKAPNVENLIITSLPFKFLARDDDTAYDRDLDLLDDPATELVALRRLEINMDRVGSSTAILLCEICPHLAHLSLRGYEGFCADNYGLGEALLWPLQCTGHLRQIKTIRIEYTDDNFLQMLASAMDPGQLHKLEVEGVPEDSEDGLADVLKSQAASLRWVTIHMDGQNPALHLPDMPNLMQLRIIGFPIFEPEAEAAQEPRTQVVPIQYATKFPKLQLLGLSGELDNFVVAEIFPEQIQPALSMETLQEIPVGVDRALMERIGRSFPNLRVIETRIPTQHQSLLISIWEYCPNIVELMLLMDEDSINAAGCEQAQARDGLDYGDGRQSLDSIFSGIPDADCHRLKLLTLAQRERELQHLTRSGRLQNLRTGASVRNLMNLRKLCIVGPGKSFCQHQKDWTGSRSDMLSIVCGYTTFAEMSSQLVFLQLDGGLADMTLACIQHICDQMKLEMVDVEMNLNMDSLDAQPRRSPLRLVKPGLGFHVIHHTLPSLKWYSETPPYPLF